MASAKTTPVPQRTKLPMDRDAARKWIILASLGLTTAVFVFFAFAPATGYPLTFDQARSLMQVILPVFLGYLGSAAYFVFPRGRRGRRLRPGSGDLIGLMVRGPIYVFTAVCIVALAAFGYSNRAGAAAGSGMSLEVLAWLVSAALGLLAVTTNVAVAYLFASEQERDEAK